MASTAPTSSASSNSFHSFFLLGVLIDSLTHRFHETGDRRDLDWAVAVGKLLIDFCPPDFTRRWMILDTIAQVVFQRYERWGKVGDVERAIVLWRDAVRLCPEDHEGRVALLFRVEKSLDTVKGELKYVEESIEIRRALLCALPRESPYRPEVLSTLARAFLTRFEGSGNLGDLDESVQLSRGALLLCSESDRYRYLSNLAFVLKTHFEHGGPVGDLNESIELLREALALCPEGHPDHFLSLSKLGNALRERCFQPSGREDVNESVQIHRDALTLCTDGHPDRSYALTNLACSLQYRFRQTQRPEDLDEAIQLHREALSLLPEGHLRRSPSLSHLGIALSTRFETYGKIKDLKESIQLHQEDLALLPVGHADRTISLSNLASSIEKLYKLSGRAEDLDQSISSYREALALSPERHPKHSGRLSNLGSALKLRFERSGRIEDLNESIQMQRGALACHSEGHLDLTISLSNLAEALRVRFNQGGRLDDLDESIHLLRSALDLCSGADHDRSGLLSNLGCALRCCFEQSGRIEDLNESIQSHRDALALLPKGHQDRSAVLSNLGASLQSRLQLVVTAEDLHDSIELHREALSLRPEGHPARPTSLNNLAGVLLKDGEHTRNVDSLNESIAYFRDCLALLPKGFPNHCLITCNIANAFYIRFEIEGRTDDYEESILLLSQAASYPFSSPLNRLPVACRWSALARRHDHSTTLTAYRTAITLLQRSLTLRPTLSTQHDLLTHHAKYQTLGVEAASYAIGKGELTAAIELLEQGRALLWSQMRGLRTSLDRLSDLNKELAVKLATCNRQLEALMTSPGTFLSGSGSQGVDATYERMQQLSNELEVIIAEIRQVPGFEDFLQAASFAKLQEAASEGPVIVINHYKTRCDALIVLSNKDMPCVCVPLDSEWFDEGLRLCNELLRTRYDRGVHAPVYDETLRRVMKTLWDRVVSKVIQKLQELGIAKGSRIWWCPTLFLASLPFHAAGPYSSDDGRTKHLLDDYISSYTPTLMSLITARSGARASRERLLFAGDTSLSAAKKERDAIRKHRRISKYLIDDEASRDSVITALRKAEWVHFACHGKLDRDKPFESSFALPGGKLTLLDIAKANLPNAELAFLSACHTAEQSPSFAMDEALHLAAGMQFCGFRSVIGTMWQLLDRDGPLLAEAVYMHLMNDTDDERYRFKGAAAAVRGAALFLRSRKDWTDDGKEIDIATERWVNLVHIGA